VTTRLPAMPPTTRREFLRGTAAGATGAVLSQALGCSKRAEDRPNLFIIVADDFGIDGVGAYGGESFATPRIDALAASGVRFETCYATPLCTPSRVELLTGKYPFRTGWVGNIDHRAIADSDGVARVVDPTLGTWAQRVRDAGYRTAAAGKWQLCHFDEHPRHVVSCGFDEYRFWYWTVDGKAKNRYWNPAIYENGEAKMRVDGAYGPDLFSESLLRFAAADDGRPWLAYYPMILPHKPYLWPPTRVGDEGIDRRMHADPEKFPAMVEYMDAVIGQIVDRLEELGQRERTVVMFLGDNGTPKEIRPRFRGREVVGGKGKLSEVGSRVPLIVSRPGTIPAGVVASDLVDLSDLFPTVLELVGVDSPRGLDGRSFAPVLRGERGAREWAYSQLGAAKSLRKGDWKWYSDHRLFDLAADPFEDQNLHGADSVAAVTAEFEALARDLT